MGLCDHKGVEVRVPRFPPVVRGYAPPTCAYLRGTSAEVLTHSPQQLSYDHTWDCHIERILSIVSLYRHWSFVAMKFSLWCTGEIFWWVSYRIIRQVGRVRRVGWIRTTSRISETVEPRATYCVATGIRKWHFVQILSWSLGYFLAVL